MVGWTVGALNAVMLIAIPPIGGHYLVDMLAGALIAGLAIVVVRRATRWHDVSKAWTHSSEA